MLSLTRLMIPTPARVYTGDNHVVGAITNDPLFGTTTASMYFEMKPNTFPFALAGTKDSIVVDSAVLILSYRGLYGDSTKPLTLRVFEISPSTPISAAKPITRSIIHHPARLI